MIIVLLFGILIRNVKTSNLYDLNLDKFSYSKEELFNFINETSNNKNDEKSSLIRIYDDIDLIILANPANNDFLTLSSEIFKPTEKQLIKAKKYIDSKKQEILNEFKTIFEIKFVEKFMLSFFSDEIKQIILQPDLDIYTKFVIIKLTNLFLDIERLEYGNKKTNEYTFEKLNSTSLKVIGMFEKINKNHKRYTLYLETGSMDIQHNIGNANNSMIDVCCEGCILIGKCLEFCCVILSSIQ